MLYLNTQKIYNVDPQLKSRFFYILPANLTTANWIAWFKSTRDLQPHTSLGSSHAQAFHSSQTPQSHLFSFIYYQLCFFINYDYRQYGEPLLEILIAGGFLAPDSSIAQDGEKVVFTECCLFGKAMDLEKVKACDQVFIKLMRQYYTLFFPRILAAWLTSPWGLNIVFSALNIVKRSKHRFLAKL